MVTAISLLDVMYVPPIWLNARDDEARPTYTCPLFSVTEKGPPATEWPTISTAGVTVIVVLS
jgi:hypothetical protein